MNSKCRNGKIKFISWGLLMIFCVLLFSCDTGRKLIHPKFEIDTGKQLSPPIVRDPIHECAEAVHVWGFIPHALVRVYANGAELIGEAKPHFASADIKLTRELSIGETVSATQTVDNMTSDHSIIPVKVAAYQVGNSGFSKPEVHRDLYDCGVIVPVGKLVESVRVKVLADGRDIGEAESPGTWKSVWTKKLKKHDKITAYQVACEDGPGSLLKSPESDPVIVKAVPNPFPVPEVDQNHLVVGNDAVLLHNLLVGAKVTVYDHNKVVAVGWATGSSNWAGINTVLTNTSSISAKQELCSVSNPPPPGKTPNNEIKKPIVVEPICNGSKFVLVRNTFINATIIVFRNNSIIGYGGASGWETLLAVSTPFATGDQVKVIQYINNTVSQPSNVVTVVDKLKTPVVEIFGGHSFFNAESGEKQIDGQVFLRGKGNGPHIRVQTCCEEKVTIQILDPKKNKIADLNLTKLYPGYFMGNWKWTSNTNWNIPGEIPVGSYYISVKTDCEQNKTEKKFYVIFDPSEVTAAGKFAFNEHGIYFGPQYAAARAGVYYLHPDDKRVFDRAIKEVNGLTEQSKASEKLLKYENQMFAYDVNWHGNDCINLIENETKAQCLDDACMLTSLLRSVGIPAHPVTGDCAYEIHGGRWGFDTWTEARFKDSNGEQWYVLHPHQGSGAGPDKRSVAGQGAGLWEVATKSFNDVIIMANENWVTSQVTDGNTDISWKYGTPCKEPNQNFSYKAKWVEHLCINNTTGQGYWGKGHWTCSPPVNSMFTINMDKDVFRVGEIVKIVVVVNNDKDEDITGPMKVKLLIDDIYSMILPDRLIDIGETEINIPAKSEEEFIFEYQLPMDLSNDYSYTIRVEFDENFASVPIYVNPLYDITTDIPDSVEANKPFTINVEVTNKSEGSVNRIATKLFVPVGVKVIDVEDVGSVTLKPNEKVVFKWKLISESPNDAAVFKVNITSANGGNAVIHCGTRVTDDPIPDYPYKETPKFMIDKE